MTTHPTAHILVNTMRASHPQMVSDTHFEITVQNQKQLELMEANRMDILANLHQALANDYVTFDIKINEGSSPRHTLSARELYDSMLHEYPVLQRLVDDFNLRLS